MTINNFVKTYVDVAEAHASLPPEHELYTLHSVMAETYLRAVKNLKMFGAQETLTKLLGERELIQSSQQEDGLMICLAKLTALRFMIQSLEDMDIEAKPANAILH